jgi:hypothetical protein
MMLRMIVGGMLRIIEKSGTWQEVDDADSCDGILAQTY